MPRIQKYFANENGKYSCPHCMQEFAQPAGVSRHVKRQHPSVNQTITIETTPLRDAPETTMVKEEVEPTTSNMCTRYNLDITNAEDLDILEEIERLTQVLCPTMYNLKPISHTPDMLPMPCKLIKVEMTIEQPIQAEPESPYATKHWKKIKLEQWYDEQHQEIVKVVDAIVDEVVANYCEPEIVEEVEERVEVKQQQKPTPKKTSKKPTIEDKYNNALTELHNHPYAHAYQQQGVFKCLAGSFTDASKLVKVYPLYCDKVRNGTLWAMQVIYGYMTDEQVQEEQKTKTMEINQDATNFIKFREALDRYTKAKKAYDAKEKRDAKPKKRDAKKQPQQAEEPQPVVQPQSSSDTSSEAGTDESCDDTQAGCCEEVVDDDNDDEEDEEEEAYFNAIDVLVAKLTNVNNIHKQVYRWITLTLKHQYITEEDFMNGVYHIYEINKQHNLKGSIPTDLYKGYETYMYSQ